MTISEKFRTDKIITPARDKQIEPRSKRSRSADYPRELSPAEIRKTMMAEFQKNISVLGPALQESRSKEAGLRTRPLITAFVALWEENETMIASKMFKESMTELRRQASVSGMDIDFIIVANNGGGKTPELGEEMRSGMRSDLRKIFGSDNYHETTTQSPVLSDKPTTPWQANIPLSAKRTEGQDRCFFVNQPRHDLNAGQLRAIRDVSHALGQEITRGYAPDALFRMDAETILKYRQSGHKFIKEPLRALYDALKKREGVIAISTKNRFERIDPVNGKAIPGLAPIAYSGIMEFDKGTRENFISFYGGSILSEPDYYAAGMSAITSVTCGNISDDFPLTQLFRAYAATQNPQEAPKVNSTWAISHLNRIPDDPKMQIQQLRRWREQGNATDQIFPELKPVLRPSGEFILRTIKDRSKALKRLGKPERRDQLKRDIKDISPGLKVALDRKPSDPIHGKPVWRHYKQK